jgi:hypothetical protein
MKVTHQLEQMEPMILELVRGVEGEDWHKSPDGKWSIAQIVGHLSIGVGLVARAFENRFDKEGMERRATPEQSLLRHMVLGQGELPTGASAPVSSMPLDKPNPEEVMADYRMGIERLWRMADEWPVERQAEVFVEHPMFGDFNLPEWVRFHFLHSKHHGEQIEKRLEWIMENQ